MLAKPAEGGCAVSLRVTTSAGVSMPRMIYGCAWKEKRTEVSRPFPQALCSAVYTLRTAVSFALAPALAYVCLCVRRI